MHTDESQPDEGSPVLSAAVVSAPDVAALAALDRAAHDEAEDEAAVPVVELVTPRAKGAGTKGPKRKLTVLVSRMSTRALERGARKADALLAEFEDDRPRTRGDCQREGLGVPGNPCPYVSCPRNLMVDPKHASLSLNRLGAAKYDVPEAQVEGNVEEIFDPGFEYTCASAAAEIEEGMTHEAIASVLGVTKQGVQQAEARAIAKLKAAGFTDMQILLDYWR